MTKHKKFLNIINVFLLMNGSIIGVGFLSGAEIWTFFARFGANFWIAIIVFFILLFWFSYKIIKGYEFENNISKMQNLPKNKANNTYLIKSKIKSFLLEIEIILFAAAMFSGLKNIIFELLSKNQITIYLVAVLFVFVLVVCGTKALSRFNGIILFLIFIIIGVLLANINVFDGMTNLSQIKSLSFIGMGESVIFAVIYIFMNIAHLVPIFKTHKLQLSKKGRLAFSFVFSLFFCILIFILTLFISKHSYLSAEEMPLLKFFSGGENAVLFVFSLALVGGLLSTLLVCLAGLKSDIQKRIKNQFVASYLVVLCPLILGFLPFNFFINVFYPIAGIINFVTLIFL